MIIATALQLHRQAAGIAQDEFAGRLRPQAADAGKGQAEARGQSIDIRTTIRLGAEGQFVVVAAGEQALPRQAGIGAGRRPGNDAVDPERDFLRAN